MYWTQLVYKPAYNVRRCWVLFAILKKCLCCWKYIFMLIMLKWNYVVRRLVKWFENYNFQKIKHHLYYSIILCELYVPILVKWFLNFKYYTLNYYNISYPVIYLCFFNDYFLEVDYLYFLTPNILYIVPMYL
jgi:hypothetical protein